MLNTISDIIGFVSSVFGIISGLYFAYKYFYDRKIGFYLWVHKIFSGRREVHFKLSYSFNYTNQNLFEIFEEAAKLSGLDYTKEINLKNQKIYNFDGVLIDIFQGEIIDDGMDDRNVFIKVVKAGVTLRTAEDIISMFGKLTLYLSEKLELEDQMYNFQMIYPENKNPFVGMKLKLMSGDNLLAFNAKINANKLVKGVDHNSPQIDIYKKEVSVNDKNYLDFSNIAKALLAA